jgi:hypothetical protein
MNDPLIEYIKIHIISLDQDRTEHEQDYVDNENDEALDEIVYLNGQIDALKHVLDMALQFDEQSLYVVG